MKKRGLALLLVLALAIGVLAIPAAAENTDEIDYRVGYAKTDINPYWSVWEATGGTIPTDLENYSVDQNGNPIGSDHIMPLPMGGYGGNVHRLSRPELIDDNGSGLHASGVVYLTSNRYTESFAKEMLGDGTDAYKAYAAEGFGQNDGDGIYATCVSFRQNATAEPVLMFSVDLISVAETYVGQAKNVIIRELKKQGVHITPDRILINATHTHGAVALGESFSSSTTYNQKLWGNTSTVPFPGSELSSYLSTYRKHLYSQLAAAAVQALTDGQTNGYVTMEKGTIDVLDAVGYQLNGVRHKKAQLTTTVDGVSQTVDYVTGSSFNVDLPGEKEIAAVSESNDLLHVLKFTFPDAKPILVINWRAHTTANNKMNTKAHNNLSADFVAAMRYQLELWGYRPILNYGTSGNLGMGGTPTTYNISTSATTTTMNATKYGCALALAAAYLSDGTSNSAVKTAYDENRATFVTKRDNAASSRASAESSAKTKEDRAASYQSKANSTSNATLKKYYQNLADTNAAEAAEYRATAASYLAEEQKWATLLEKMDQTVPVMGTCAQGQILLETTYYNVAYQSTSDADYQAALYHNALAVDEGGSATNDGGLKLEKTGYPFVVKAGTYTANGKTFEIDSDVVIASQYHANGLKNRHGVLNAKRISLSAFMLGQQVAFVTVPFEASDRYSMDVTLENASADNDWDDLINNEAWGTPFVMSLTNGAEGYIPNNLAYTYDRDLEARTLAGTIGQNFVAGSYEAHTAYAAAGEGEKIVAELNTLLRGLSDGQTMPALKTGYCQACKTEATWVPLSDKVLEDNGGSLATGHYYLEKDLATIFGAAMVYLNETVCLDLNGNIYFSNTNVGYSRAFVLYGTLNVQDSAGGGTMAGKAAGGGNGGTILVDSPGTLNLYSGALTCETSGEGTVCQGGVVYVGDGGVFNMFGGSVTGGKVTDYGGNVSAQHSGKTGGTFNMYGGTISGGTAGSTSYANLMVSGYSTFRFSGGSITSGAFMQGTMYLGSRVDNAVNQSTSTIAVRNNGKIILDGVFTGKVTLDFTNSKVYPAKPTTGETIGTVIPGSWIDHANGAKISAKGVSTYVAVVDGKQLLMGTKPASGYCDICKANVNWMPMTNGAVNGHFALNESMADMEELVIPAHGKLCLDLGGNTYTAAGRAFTVNGVLNISSSKTGGLLQGAAVDGADGGTIYVSDQGAVNHHGGEVTCVSADGARINAGGVVFLESGRYTLCDGSITGGNAVAGGNMYVAGGSLELTGGTISGGSAENGGNLYLVSETGYTMAGGTVAGGNAAKGGNIYLGAKTDLTMTGGVISDGTATGNGGNIYVPANAEFILSGGNVSGGTATGNGGSIYVAAKGAMQITSGSISGGTTTGNGGNIYVVSDATLTMNGGTISGGRAEKADTTTMGGNIYCGGKFTMDAGTITGGYAYFGGNVQIQSAAASFTMRGGLIEKGSAGYNANVADLCTGQAGSENGYSQFRMEGGFIAGRAYIQGLATLTGTTDGDVPMNISVKAAADRLTFEGKYTGKLKIAFTGTTYQLGDKIGNAVNADLSEATITLAGMAGKGVAVVNDELRMVISGVAKIGDMGYETFAEAMAAYADSAAPVVLLTNLDLGTLTKDLYLDLNGFAVTAANANGYKLYCLDSATDDYTVADGIYGTVPSSVGALAAEGYLAITEDSKTSFHKYEMTVTHLVVNTKKVGLTYKSSFRGDEMVKAQIKEFGVAVQVLSAPTAEDILQDTELRSHAALQQDAWQVGNTENDLKSVYIVNILREGETAERNNVRADIQVYGVCYMQLLDGTVLLGQAESQSLKSAMQYMNSEDIWNNYLTDEDKTELASFYNTWSEVMQTWADIDRIKETAASL